MTSGHTAPGIFPFVEARHKEAGLHPVTALKESSGFIFNRIWAAIKREVMAVLAEGVSTPEVIDGIWKEQYNSLIGPCAMMGYVLFLLLERFYMALLTKSAVSLFTGIAAVISLEHSY